MTLQANKNRKRVFQFSPNKDRKGIFFSREVSFVFPFHSPALMLGLHLHVWPVSQYTCRSRIEKDEKEREGESHHSLPTKKITYAQSFRNIRNNVEVAYFFLNRKSVKSRSCRSLWRGSSKERETAAATTKVALDQPNHPMA